MVERSPYVIRTGPLVVASLILAATSSDPWCDQVRKFGAEQDWARAGCPVLTESREAVLNVYYVTTHQSLGADFEHCMRLTAESLNITAHVSSCNLAPRYKDASMAAA